MNLFQKPWTAFKGVPSEPSAAPKRPVSVAQPSDAGFEPDAIALPTEEALLVRVHLPLASHRQRQAAAGFAVEDLIAEPLEAVHVALGPELDAGEFLAVVVRRPVMDQWASRTDSVRKRLVPDVLALPVPASGGVSVREVSGRVLVRRADGTGYATRAEAFETFWRAEGAPQIVLFGGRLPDGLPVSAAGLLPAGAASATPGFDLMQGPWARGFGEGRKLALRFAAVLVVTLTAHIAILGAKTVALQRIAAEREAVLRAELALRVPGLPADAPLELALRRALPSHATAQGGGFMPLAARVSAVLLPAVGDISVRNLVFGAEDGSLAILVEGPDLATLQRIETSLTAAGLTVAPGVATTGDGMAEVRYVIGTTGG